MFQALMFTDLMFQPRRTSSAETIVDHSVWAEVNVKEQLSYLSASSRRSEDVPKCLEWRCLQNEDGFENTLKVFCFVWRNSFVLKAAS